MNRLLQRRGSGELNGKIARNVFYDQDHNPLTNEQIQTFVEKAYSDIGVIYTAEGLRSEATGWMVGVDDQDPSKFHGFVSYKETPWGKKVMCIAHDNSPEGILDSMKALHALMRGDGVYLEASGRVEELMKTLRMPIIPVETAIKMMPGKNVVPVDEYHYTRTLTGGGDKQFTKAMFGRPKIAGSKSSSEVPPTLYHTIEPYYRYFILANGLDPANYAKKGVFLASKAREGELQNPEKYDQWEVDVQGLVIEPDTTTGTYAETQHDEDWGTPWYVCHQVISPQRLKLLTPDYQPRLYLDEEGEETSPDYDPVKRSSHKTPPMADNTYGEGTNGWALMPEKQKGTTEFPPLELMMPEEFADGAIKRAEDRTRLMDEGLLSRLSFQNYVTREDGDFRTDGIVTSLLEGKEIGRFPYSTIRGRVNIGVWKIHPDYLHRGVLTTMVKYIFEQTQYPIAVTTRLAAALRYDGGSASQTVWQNPNWKKSGEDLTPKTKYEKVCHAIATDDKLWGYFADYVQCSDAFEDRPADSSRVVALVQSIPAFDPPTARGCLYRGEAIRMGDDCLPAKWEPHLRPLLSWSVNWDTAKSFAENRGIVWKTVGKIKGIALGDIVRWRNWTHPNESNYEGMQAEWFILNTCKAIEADRPEQTVTRVSSKTAKSGVNKQSCVMVVLPPAAAGKVLRAAASIPEEELGEKGCEDEPHITVKFGVKDDIEALAWAVGEQEPFTATFGKLHVFTPSASSGQSPIVVEVNAPQLSVLHELVDSSMGIRKDDFDYKPHATLAFVKPEFAKKYEGSDMLAGVNFSVKNITLSRANGERQMVPLAHMAVTASAAPQTEEEIEAFYNAQFPVAHEGALVDGREVIDNVDNMSSIAASFMNYLILEDVRVVDFSLFDMPPDVNRRTKALAEEIRQSGQLMPLIVGVDSVDKGPFIVEGSHRYDALKILGAKAIPAIVVLDLDELLPKTASKTSAVPVDPAELKIEHTEAEAGVKSGIMIHKFIAKNPSGVYIGKISFLLYPNNVAQINNVWVEYNFRRQGYASYLYRYGFDFLKKLGAIRVVSPANFRVSDESGKVWEDLKKNYPVESTPSHTFGQQDYSLSLASTRKKARVIGPVYHGTPHVFDSFELTKGTRTFFGLAEISVASNAFFFTPDRKIARNWAENRRNDRKQPLMVLECSITLSNPVDLRTDAWTREAVTVRPLPMGNVPDTYQQMTTKSPTLEPITLLEALREYTEGQVDEAGWNECGIDIENLKVIKESALFLLVDSKPIVEALKFLKYDGMILNEANDPDLGGVSYAVFSASQIKVHKKTKVGRSLKVAVKTSAQKRGPLYAYLLQYRPLIAKKAQAVYDSWEQDESGLDEEAGSGGICDEIAREIEDVIMCTATPNVSVTEGGQDGDDHAWVIAYSDTEVYGVDIHHSVYETGGGMSWKKRPGVQITADDVDVWPIDINPQEFHRHLSFNLASAASVHLYRGMSSQEFEELERCKTIQPSSYNNASSNLETAEFYSQQHDDPGVIIEFDAPEDALQEDEVYKGDYRVIKPIRVPYTLKTAAEPRKPTTHRNFLWAVPPNQGLLLNYNMTLAHKEWFEEIGLPTYGRGFDEIPRGTGRIYPDLRVEASLPYAGELNSTRQELIPLVQDALCSAFPKSKITMGGEVIKTANKIRIQGCITCQGGDCFTHRHLSFNQRSRVANSCCVKVGAEQFSFWPPQGLGEGISRDNPVLVKVPVSEIWLSQQSMEGGSRDISRGARSKTRGPISLFYNTSNHQLLVEDGVHRLVQAFQRGQTSIDAYVWSAGYSDIIANVRPEERVKLAQGEAPIVVTEPYLYHGTSSKYRESIEKQGLKPQHKSIYVTTDPHTAAQEANWTCHGDVGAWKGSGGTPIVVVLNPKHPSLQNLKYESKATHQEMERIGEKDYIFKVPNPIPPSAFFRILEQPEHADNYGRWIEQAMPGKTAARSDDLKQQFLEIAEEVRAQVIPGRDAEPGDCDPVCDALVEALQAQGFEDAQIIYGDWRGQPHSVVWAAGYTIDATRDQFASYMEEEEMSQVLTRPVLVEKTQKAHFADWGRASEIQRGDTIVSGGAMKVLKVYPEGDEIIVLGPKNTVRRFAPEDEVSVWRNRKIAETASGSVNPLLRYRVADDEAYRLLLDFEAGKLQLLEEEEVDPQELVTQEDVASLEKAEAYAKMWEEGSLPPAVPVARLTDGTLVILNGQHRSMAAVLAKKKIPIQIYGRKTSTLRKRAFKIEVPTSSRSHFWDEPPAGNLEFWAFRHPVIVLPGEKIIFTFDGTPVAYTMVHHTEKPGQSKCEQSGKYENSHKVYWDPAHFRGFDGSKKAANQVLSKELLQQIAWEVRDEIMPSRDAVDGDCEPVSHAIVEKLHVMGYKDAYAVYGQFEGKAQHPHVWVACRGWEIDATQDQFARFADEKREAELLDHPVYVGKTRKNG